MAAPIPPPSDPDFDHLVAATEGIQPGRRMLHALTGLTIAAILTFADVSWSMTVGILAVLAALTLLSDLLRLTVKPLNRLFFRLFRAFASPREASGIASSTWYLIGCLLAIAIFPTEVAVAGILVLALADPAASVIGRRWGRRPFGSGTIEGTVVFATVASLVLLPIAGFPAALVAGVGVALAERIPWPLDDNLTIPLIAGALVWNLIPIL